MKKVLIFTTAMGHQSLAQAGKQAFEQAGWQTKIYFSNFRPELRLYNFLAGVLPFVWRWWFTISQKPLMLKFFRPYLGLRKKAALEKAIKNFQPDLVISTYFIYNFALARFKKKFGFKFFNLLADPRTIHPSTICSQADLNLVYDQQAAWFLKNFGLPEKKIKIIGWLTKKDFYQASYQKKNSAEFVILFCGGSWGRLHLLKILPLFLNLPLKTRLILVAGKSRLLYFGYQLFKIAVEKKTKIEVYRFLNDLERFFCQSDLIVGKAGPNLLFESVAAGRPFLAISHIPGQEDGNLAIIEEKKLGWVAESREKLKKILIKIFQDPSFYRSVLKRIKKERRKNQKAAKKLVNLASLAVE